MSKQPLLRSVLMLQPLLQLLLRQRQCVSSGLGSCSLTHLRGQALLLQLQAMPHNLLSCSSHSNRCKLRDQLGSSSNSMQGHNLYLPLGL
jgi:hypothetical protein